MERLTFSPCDECNYSYTKNNQISNVCKICEFKNYIDLEEQGLLLRLPCKLGTKVYYVQKCLAPSCKECRGFLQVNNCYCDYKARIFEQYFEYRHLKAFGQSVFLTKEEAEAALKEMEKLI